MSFSHKFKNCFINLKKDFLELLNNKMVLILWLMAFIFLLILPFANNQFFNNKIKTDSQNMLFLVQIIGLFFTGQYIYDGCKKDFSNGGGIFLLNINSSWKACLFGKKTLAFGFLFILFLCRIGDVEKILNWKEIILLILFYDFVINNAFLFSLLFYAEKSSILGFFCINFIPLLLFGITAVIKFYWIKYLLVILAIFLSAKNIPRAFYSKKFRKNLS